MAEENVQENTANDGNNESATDQTDLESLRSDRPNPFAFATLLFGGWAALMIVLTLIAVVAMSVVGIVAG